MAKVLKRRRRAVPKKRKLSQQEMAELIEDIRKDVKDATEKAEVFRDVHQIGIDDFNLRELINFAYSYRVEYYNYRSRLRKLGLFRGAARKVKIIGADYLDSYKKRRLVDKYRGKGQRRQWLLEETVQHIDKTTEWMYNLARSLEKS